MVVGCVVSESISAQNKKKSVTDGRTDRPTSPKLYPFALRGITGAQACSCTQTYCSHRYIFHLKRYRSQQDIYFCSHKVQTTVVCIIRNCTTGAARGTC